MDDTKLIALLRMPLPERAVELDARHWARLRMAIRSAAYELERRGAQPAPPATAELLSARQGAQRTSGGTVTVDGSMLDALFGIDRPRGV